MFTKEHYIKIAKVLKIEEMHKPFYKELVARNAHTGMVHNFIELFENDNPKFVRSEFLDAIYGKEEKHEER